MEKNMKKTFTLSIIGMFLLMFAVSFAAAAIGDAVDTPGVQQAITEPAWLVLFIKFMGFGETWSTVIISLAVLLMIFAAAYDILGFSAFESNWVKYSIAGGIAVVAAVSRGVTLIVSGLMGIVGGSVAFATVLAIALAIVFFVVGTFFKGKMKVSGIRQDAKTAEAAFELGQAKSTADIKAAAAAATAVK